MKRDFTNNIERLVSRQRVATENFVTTLQELAAHYRAAADDLSQEANRQIERCGFGGDAPAINLNDPNFEIPTGIKPRGATEIVERQRDPAKDVIEPIREHLRDKQTG